MRSSISVIERFVAKVDRRGPDECWLWQAAVSSTGYGQFHPSKTEQCTAHSFAFRLEHGEIPDGMVVDHECHNRDRACPGGRECKHRLCVNPAHLVPRSNDENLRRGPRFNGSKTHCPRGHAYTPENTRLIVKPNTTSRTCRTCQRDRDSARMKGARP